jgi:hypothetical protein
VEQCPERPEAVGDYNIYVMASWSQVSPKNWLIFSKKCITEFFDNGLGASFKRT